MSCYHVIVASDTLSKREVVEARMALQQGLAGQVTFAGCSGSVFAVIVKTKNRLEDALGALKHGAGYPEGVTVKVSKQAEPLCDLDAEAEAVAAFYAGLEDAEAAEESAYQLALAKEAEAKEAKAEARAAAAAAALEAEAAGLEEALTDEEVEAEISDEVNAEDIEE